MKDKVKTRIKDRVWFTPVIDPQQGGMKAEDFAEAAAKMAIASPLPETEPMLFQRVRDLDPTKVAKVQIGDEVISVECVEVKCGPDDTATTYDSETGEEYTRHLEPGEMVVTFRRRELDES